MATEAEVAAVLADLVERMDRLPPGNRQMLPTGRSVQLHCTDIDVTYRAQLEGGRITSLEKGTASDAQIRIACRSDDLVAVGRGEMSFFGAYTSGRVSLHASTTDLLRLQALL